MIETPALVDVPAQHVAALHIRTPRARMQQVMGPGITEAMAAAKSQGLGPSGPWFAHHLRMTDAEFDFDICVPVTAPVEPVGRVRAWERPAIRVVRTVYQGPYDGLGDAWQAFMRWIEANGVGTAADLYERYLVGPEADGDPSTWRTELSRPAIG